MVSNQEIVTFTRLGYYVYFFVQLFACLVPVAFPLGYFTNFNQFFFFLFVGLFNFSRSRTKKKVGIKIFVRSLCLILSKDIITFTSFRNISLARLFVNCCVDKCFCYSGIKWSFHKKY